MSTITSRDQLSTYCKWFNWLNKAETCEFLGVHSHTQVMEAKYCTKWNQAINRYGDFKGEENTEGQMARAVSWHVDASMWGNLICFLSLLCWPEAYTGLQSRDDWWVWDIKGYWRQCGDYFRSLDRCNFSLVCSPCRWIASLYLLFSAFLGSHWPDYTIILAGTFFFQVPIFRTYCISIMFPFLGRYSGDSFVLFICYIQVVTGDVLRGCIQGAGGCDHYPPCRQASLCIRLRCLLLQGQAKWNEAYLRSLLQLQLKYCWLFY